MISAKQKKIASKAGDPNKIDAKDFAVLKAEKAKGRGMGLQDEQLPPGKMENAKHGKMIKSAKGGSLFKGRETYGEELREAKAVASKKISPKQFVKGEKSEGEKNTSNIAKKIASGKMSPKQYATMETSEKMAKGGSVMARGNKIARIRPTKLY